VQRLFKALFPQFQAEKTRVFGRPVIDYQGLQPVVKTVSILDEDAANHRIQRSFIVKTFLEHKP